MDDELGVFCQANHLAHGSFIVDHERAWFGGDVGEFAVNESYLDRLAAVVSNDTCHIFHSLKNYCPLNWDKSEFSLLRGFVRYYITDVIYCQGLRLKMVVI